ncbi:MAG: hypothetical protein OEM26_18885, partial [Saprospiraceae bacterium]|nr:hypothetical protein [Saprospiraceae bacterium]
MISQIEEFQTRLYNFLFRERYFLFFCIGISVLAFGFELSNASISIDEEVLSIEGAHRGVLVSD